MTNQRNKVAALLAGFFAALLVAGVSLFAPTTASAETEIWLDGASISVSPSVGVPGQTITVTVVAPGFGGSTMVLNVWPAGSGYWAAGEEPLAMPEATVNADGVAIFTVSVPSGLSGLELSAWIPINEEMYTDVAFIEVPIGAAAAVVAAPQCGTQEAAGGGLALPGGSDSVPAGGLMRVRLASGANEHVALAVQFPGGGRTEVGGTTNDEGNAFFNIRVPARTAAGEGYIQGAANSGAVIFDACFTVAGRAVHPAAG